MLILAAKPLLFWSSTVENKLASLLLNAISVSMLVLLEIEKSPSKTAYCALLGAINLVIGLNFLDLHPQK